MPPNHLWSHERVELVKKLFDDGVSASVAAMKLGGVTRNAIIGKWHRLGLVRAYGRPKKKPMPRRVKVKALRMRAMRKKIVIPHLPVEPLPPPEITDVPRVSFADLERHHCRFPVGDPKEPTFGFCGCQPYPGLPYCEAHARRAYTPATLKTEPCPSFNVSIRQRRPARELVDA